MDKIDAEKLFSALYLKRLKFLNSQLQNSLKSVIKSFDYSKEKALEEIQALDLGVKDIEKIYEKLRANLEEEYSSVAVGSVVRKVLEEIREQKSYLTSLTNKPNEFNSEIESIMQQSLIKNAKRTRLARKSEAFYQRKRCDQNRRARENPKRNAG